MAEERNLSQHELDILTEQAKENIIIRILGAGSSASPVVQPWMAMLQPKLKAFNKTIYCTGSKQYYKQTTIDTYYPTNPESSRLAPPFNEGEGQAYLGLEFVNTTSGTKIYEYALQLCEKNMGYKHIKPVSVALTQHRFHKVMVVADSNNVWVLSNEINDKLVYDVIAYAPILYSDYSWGEPEDDLLKGCRAKLKNEDITPYLFKMLEIAKADRDNQKVIAIQKMLNYQTQRAIDKIDREIDSTEGYIQSYINNVHNYETKKQELLVKRLGYMTKKRASEDDVKNLLDYIDKTGYIDTFDMRKFSGYDMPFVVVKTPITIFETEPLEKTIEVRLNEMIPTSKRDLYRALHKIFIEGKYQMYCETKLKIDMSDSTVYARPENTNHNVVNYDYIPQPHLALYNCWGVNETEIRHAIRDTDIIAALNLIIIATRNINFTDTIVLSNWINQLDNSNHLKTIKSCKNKETGEMVSLKEIIDEIIQDEIEHAEVFTPELEE
jgi:hypothetical protein